MMQSSTRHLAIRLLKTVNTLFPDPIVPIETFALLPTCQAIKNQTAALEAFKYAPGTVHFPLYYTFDLGSKFL